MVELNFRVDFFFLLQPWCCFVIELLVLLLKGHLVGAVFWVTTPRTLLSCRRHLAVSDGMELRPLPCPFMVNIVL